MPGAALATFTHQSGLVFYLDTSALLPLVLMPTGKVAGHDQVKVGRLTTFIAKAQKLQGRFICSVLTIEEIASIVRARKQADLAQLDGYKTWKELKDADPTRAASHAGAVQAHATGALKMAVTEMKTYSIGVEQPIVTDGKGATLDSGAAGAKLRAVHSAFLSRYPTLDSMDALHIVFGSTLGCRHFVSFDNGWQPVTEILVLN